MIRPSSYHGEDEEMENLTAKPKDQQKEIEIPFCGCLSVQYYRPYFDVDTQDILDRISHSLLFCRREENFLTMIGDKPDAYGPVWIATTLVFVVAVSSHLNGWFTSWMKGNMWEYNFQSVLSASSLLYGFLFCAPALIYFIFKQYDPKLKFVTVFCLYGYSLFPFGPALFICLLPSAALGWVSLFAATISSTIFLLRNLAPIVIDKAKKQAALLLGVIGVVQLVFMLCLKLYFFFEES